jgi:Domain of unknown function (DUF4337)
LTVIPMSLATKQLVPPSTGSEPRRPIERIIIITPVLLTLIATVLAGLSSSEMIQAQYHRSLAAQEQSKAGDQWAFFQSKRIRGTIVEQTAGRAATPMPVDINQLKAVVEDMNGALASASARMAEEAKGAAQVTQDSYKKALTRIASAQTAGAAALVVLDKPEVQAVIAYLGTERLPTVDSPGPPAATVQAALKAGGHESDAEVASMRSDDVQSAIDAATGNEKRFSDAAKQVDQRLTELDRALAPFQLAARQMHQALEHARLADDRLAKAAAASGGVAALDREDRRLQLDLTELEDYRAARADYTVRRNAREAELNQHLAELYELQVAKSSLESEHHRRRSKNFFYGMLAAQAGVALASFSLAARQKEGLWALAGVAGLAAVGFSFYVYMYL